MICVQFLKKEQMIIRYGMILFLIVTAFFSFGFNAAAQYYFTAGKKLMNSKTDLAASYLEKAVMFNDTDIEYKRFLAFSYMMNKQHDKALNMYLTCIKDNTYNWFERCYVYDNLGYLFSSKDAKRSAEYYKETLKYNTFDKNMYMHCLQFVDKEHNDLVQKEIVYLWGKHL